MVIASFFIENKQEKSCFFKKSFLLADINMDIAVRMTFYNLSNIEIDFIDAISIEEHIPLTICF